MHSNNNKAVINKVSKRMLRTDRIKNIFSVMAIILTTFMISVIFSIGISFSQNYSVYKVRANRSVSEITLNNPTSDQYKEIIKKDYIDHVGLRIKGGSVKVVTEDNQTAKIPMTYYDETEWEKHYIPAISDIKGTYPIKENEIMLSAIAMEYLGVRDAQVGERIMLTYRRAEGEISEEFILTGWFRDYSISDINGTPMILVSQKFCSNHNLDMESYGTLTISMSPSKKEIVYGRLSQDITISEDQEWSTVFDLTGSASEAAKGSVIVITMLALFIVLSGYLLIYNIMYISISKDINFYGMIKTIGTTSRQIRTLVRRQLYLLALVGIPVGLLLGAVVSNAIVPVAMNVMGGYSENSIMPSEISFHPIIFIGTALFSLLTIAISLRKPAKVAGNVSPIEALRYTEVKETRKKKEKRSKNGGKLFWMALSNVMRDKKKALLVFASLFMGCITLLSINGFLGSIDLENYLNRYIPHNFSYESQPPISLEKFDSQFVDTIEAMDGVKMVETMNSAYALIEFDEVALDGVLKSDYHEYARQETTFEDFVQSMGELSRKEGFYADFDLSYGSWLLAVDDDYIEEYNKTSKDKINLKDFNEGKIVLMAGNSGGYLDSMVGKTLSIMNEASNEVFDINIGGLIGYNLISNTRGYAHVVGTPPVLVVSKDFINTFSDGKYYIDYIYIDCDNNKEETLLESLRKLNNSRLDTTFNFKSRIEEGETFASSINTVKVISNGISAILLLVGVLNFINVMITGVNSRRRELAIIESIGMTKKQIGKMLSLEGLLYAVITSALIMTVGNLILWFISDNVSSVADYAVFEYPISLIAILITIIFAVCLVVPVIVFKSSSKGILVERLRSVVS